MLAYGMLDFIPDLFSFIFTAFGPLVVTAAGLYAFYTVVTVGKRGLAPAHERMIAGHSLIILSIVFGYWVWLQQFIEIQLELQEPNFSHGPVILAFFVAILAYGLAKLLEMALPGGCITVGILYSCCVVFGLT